jgi:hypothetical protein
MSAEFYLRNDNHLRRVLSWQNNLRRSVMGKGLILWLLGVPLSVIILLGLTHMI